MKNEKLNSKTKNRILIIGIILFVLLFNVIFVFSILGRRAYTGAYSKERIEDAFKEQFPLVKFENITTKEQGKILAVIGYKKNREEVCCAVFTQSLSYNRWRCEEKVQLDKRKNPSEYIEIPSYGKVYLAWNQYQIKRVVVEREGKQTEKEIAPDEFIFRVTDYESDKIFFYDEDGTPDLSRGNISKVSGSRNLIKHEKSSRGGNQNHETLHYRDDYVLGNRRSTGCERTTERRLSF